MIETLAATAYTTMVIDGGMRMPSVPPAAMEPVASASEYPKRFIDGYATLLMVAAVAIEEPQMAPKPARFAISAWFALMVPARTPRKLVYWLNGELVAASASGIPIAGASDATADAPATAEARDWFHAQGAEVVADTPQEFAAIIRAEHARWGAIIREAGIRAE